MMLGTTNIRYNNQNEEIGDTKWENVKKVVTMVASKVAGYGERKKRNDCYDEECQIKVGERNRSQIKMLNRRIRMNTTNYKNKRREAMKMCTAKKRAQDHKVQEGMEEANKEMKQENSIK